jgi:hypothetical protein
MFMIIADWPNIWSQLLVDTIGLHQVWGLEFNALVLKLLLYSDFKEAKLSQGFLMVVIYLVPLLTPKIPWDQKLVDCYLGSLCEEK